MAVLVPSLKAVFNELNTVWPQRDKKTDGWIGDSKHCPGTSDHCADSSGRVHAIDIDKDGIDPMYVINRLIEFPTVFMYLNYNYKKYHVNQDFEPRPLGGSDPHTSHIHVSIKHTDYARGYTGGYGIVPVNTDYPIPIPELQLAPATDWDHSPFLYQFGGVFADMADQTQGYANAIEGLRI